MLFIHKVLPSLSWASSYFVLFYSFVFHFFQDKMKAALIMILIFFLVTNEGGNCNSRKMQRPLVKSAKEVTIYRGGEMYMYSDLF